MKSFITIARASKHRASQGDVTKRTARRREKNKMARNAKRKNR